MTNQIQQLLDASSNKTPQAIAARARFLDALVTWRDDQRRFDQAVYWAAVHGSWLNESGSQQQIAKAEQQGNQELVRRVKENQRYRRMWYAGWKLAMHAALVNLKLSLDGYHKAVRSLTNDDHYVLDSIRASDVKNFIKDVAPVDETGYPSAYHMDVYRLRGLLREDSHNLDLAAVRNTYAEWVKGTWTPSMSVFGPAAHSCTFISWKTCAQPLVGAHLLVPFAQLIARYTMHGADSPHARIPVALDHAYQQVNQPQFASRVKELENGSIWDTNVETAYLEFNQVQKRAQFIAQVDEAQGFLRDLRAFNDQLLAFVTLHRAERDGIDKLTGFEKAAAQYNLLSAVSVSSDLTKLIDELEGQMLRKYLPRADRVRPLVEDNVFLVAREYEKALNGLTAFNATDDLACADAVTRLGVALLESESAAKCPTYGGR